PERIYYTTDAMAAAGAGSGEFSLGRLRLRVGEDGIVRLPGTNQFAGSSLRPRQMVERATAMLGEPSTVVPTVLETAWRWLGGNDRAHQTASTTSVAPSPIAAEAAPEPGRP